jgi:drug/metabolite transporter (DMT)-like permease
MDLSPSAKHATAWGVLCGAGSALFWAFGFVAARQGVTAGLSPLVIALDRFALAGLAMIPIVAANNFGNFRGLGWRRAVALTVFGGFPLALLSYVGYVFVPLGHGAVIQPSCAALGGLALARVVLKEPMPLRRIGGAFIIVAGLAVIGAEALTTIGSHGILGDLLFVAAGSFFAIFGTLLRKWRIDAISAAVVTSVLSIVAVPMLFGAFDNMLAAGFYENALQAIVQGVFAGAGATYLFTRAVVLLGAGRAAVYPALVPVFTLFVGFIALGAVPSVSQLVGLTIVVIGFRFVVK